MKTNNPFQTSLFPEPERYDLFLLIEPSEDVIRDTKNFKQKAFNEIGYFDSFNSKPHISLDILETTEELIQKDINWLIKSLAHITTFEICLEGFGIFQHGSTKTIYMNIMNTNSIMNLYNRIFHNKKSFNPHITIAKNITDDQNNRIWPLFQDAIYRKNFMCNHISILIRPYGSFESWRPHTKITFSK